MKLYIQSVVPLAMLSLVSAKAVAQVQVRASIDSMVIQIGQQTDLTVDVTAKQGSTVLFPEFDRTQNITPGVEVLESYPVDTSTLDDGYKRVTKRFVLTSFEDSLYAIPGMTVKVDGTEYSANELALKVLTVEVDTLHPENFFPPKGVQSNPFKWEEWASIFWMSLIILLLFVAVCYLVIRLKQNKPVVTRIRIVKRILPHQKALTAITALKADRELASHDQKAYYTQLTDALRQYIEERFGFKAMEMTSAEILTHLQQSGDKTMMEELQELFRTADLVKFAKYSALLNENDLNLVNAINFIDTTKLEGQPTEERILPKLSDDDIKAKKNRKLIKALITAACIVIFALICVVVYRVYQLTI